jgi:hypothetical protein
MKEDRDEKAANQAAVDKVKAAVAKPEEAHDEPEEEEEQTPAATPAEAIHREESRQERRRNRYREQVEAREKAQRENEELRRQVDQERSQRLALETATLAMRQTQQQQRPAEAQPDPLDKEIALHEKELLTLQREYRMEMIDKAARKENFTQDEIDAWNQRCAKIENAKHEAMIRKVVRAQAPSQQVDPTAAAMFAQIRLRHQDVVDNQVALRWADAELSRRMARGARQDMDTIDAVMDRTREEFGLQPRNGGGAKPDTRHRYGGAAAGGSGGVAPAAPAAGKLLDPTHQKMARAMWPDLPEKQAYERFQKRIAHKIKLVEG